MNICSIDQARNSGWAIFKDNKLIKYGLEKIAKENIKYEQLLYPAREFAKKIILENKIDFVFLEEIQFQSNQSVYSKLSMLLGTLISLFEEMGIPYLRVSSNTWKSFCGIKKRGREQEKKDAIEFVRNEYKIEVDSDIADAICIGHYGINKEKSNGKH